MELPTMMKAFQPFIIICIKKKFPKINLYSRRITFEDSGPEQPPYLFFHSGKTSKPKPMCHVLWNNGLFNCGGEINGEKNSSLRLWAC